MAGTVVTASRGSVGPRSGFRVCASPSSLLGGVGEHRSFTSAGTIAVMGGGAFGNGMPDMGVTVALLARHVTIDQGNCWRSTE